MGDSPALTRDQKRLMMHLHQKFNYTMEDALQKALSMNSGGPLPIPNSPSKRQKFTIDPPIMEPVVYVADPAPKMIKKEPKPEDLEPNEDASECKPCRPYGIVGKNPFTKEEANKIRDAIVSTVRARKSAIPPEFYAVKLVKGHLICRVADKESGRWLTKYQEDIAEASGCELKVYKEKDIPVDHLFRARFNFSAQDTSADILDILESYSREPLPATKWTIQERIVEREAAILTVRVDTDSAEYIRLKNCKLPYKLGHAKFYELAWNETESNSGGSQSWDNKREPRRRRKRESSVSHIGNGSYTFPIPTCYPLQKDT